jgi:hypothetical protein
MGFLLVSPREWARHLLYLIVERSLKDSDLMLSALVLYKDGSDAGTGFYTLAQDLGKLMLKGGLGCWR